MYKRIKNRFINRHLYINVHSSIIPNSQEAEAAHKTPVGYGMEYFSAFKKRKEILIHTTTWMNLEDIMLNEKCQSKKDI